MFISVVPGQDHKATATPFFVLTPAATINSSANETIKF